MPNTQKQDSLGNIYISRQGRDPELADIALAFPLDLSDGPAFKSAFAVFSQLRNDDLLSGSTLMGFTSIKEGVSGRDLWKTASSASPPSASSPHDTALGQFSGFTSPSEISFSALIEVSETEDDPLRICGSPVLVQKAQAQIEDAGSVQVAYQNSLRAPHLRITGSLAERVAKATVGGYSEYIAALFDNFD